MSAGKSLTRRLLPAFRRQRRSDSRSGEGAGRPEPTPRRPLWANIRCRTSFPPTDNGNNFAAIENEIFRRGAVSGAGQQLRAGHGVPGDEETRAARACHPGGVRAHGRPSAKCWPTSRNSKAKRRRRRFVPRPSAKPPRCSPWRRREATHIRGQGEARSRQVSAEFQQNPELAKFLFRLNALENSSEGTLDADL